MDGHSISDVSEEGWAAYLVVYVMEHVSPKAIQDRWRDLP